MMDITEDFYGVLYIKKPSEVFKQATGFDLVIFKLHWPRFTHYREVVIYRRESIEYDYGEIERVTVYDDHVEIKTVEYIITVSGRNGGEFTAVRIPVTYKPALLCRIGIHRWRYYGGIAHFDAVIGFPTDKPRYRRCLKCGKDQWYAYYRNQGGDRIGIGWRDKDATITIPLVR
jgi:hypothetical protein